VTGIGSWNTGTREFSGMTASFRGNAWYIDPTTIPASNPNANLKEIDANGIKGFWTSPGDANVKITRMRDAGGDFLRIESRSHTPYFVVNGARPLAEADGAPISVLAVARVPEVRDLSVSIHDVTDRLGAHQSRVLSVRPRAGEWVSLVVRLQESRFPVSGDNYAIGLGPVKPGDYFDLRFFGAYVGLIP